jgi:hypothetical protein
MSATPTEQKYSLYIQRAPSSSGAESGKTNTRRAATATKPAARGSFGRSIVSWYERL